MSLLEATSETRADGQAFFTSEIERLRKRVAEYELKKTTGSRSLKTFLMAKE